MNICSRFIILLVITIFSTRHGYGQEAKLMFTFGHTRAVSFALFSPDGKKIITSSADKTGKIWDAATGNVVADLRGNKSRIYSEEFSPDGSRILTASFDSTAKVWDVNTGELILDLKGHLDEVWGAHYSRDGKIIGSCSKDGTAKIWDATTGKLLITLSGHSGYIQNLCFSPDRKTIVTASYDRTARIWDATSGTLMKILTHTDTVYSAKYSNDGRYILTASKDSTAKIWDAKTGELFKDLKGNSAGVWTAEFSWDDQLIVTTCLDSTAKLWDARTGNLIFDLKGHKESIWYAQFSPDNKKIATASSDRTVKIWDVATGKILVDIAAHKGKVRTVTFSKDGSKIVSASDDRTAKVWDSKTGDLLLDLKGYASGIWSVKISPDGKKILMACGDNTAKIWDINKGIIQYELKGHTDSVTAAVYSPDGKKIVTISNDKLAKLWQADNGNFLTDLKGHNSKLSAVRFSPDGKIIATGSRDGIIRTWNGENGIFLNEYVEDSSEIMSIEFSHSGKSIIATLKKGIAVIWNLENKNVTAHFILNNFILNNINRAFSPTANSSLAEFNKDDSKVVTCDGSSVVNVWDANTGKRITTIMHNDRVYSARFSPDGKKILTASFDNTAKIWDAENGMQLVNMVGHNYALTLAEFTSDGNKVITSSRDNTAKIWDASTGKIITDFNAQLITPWLNNEVETGNYNSGQDLLVTASGKTSVSIWDAKTAKLRYVFFTVNSGHKQADYLVLDKDGHYDGTPAAMKLLYFTCGTEFISLEQAKDKLWEPGLAGRIMKNDSIYGTKLSALNLCSYTPEVEEMDKGLNEFRFKITPRKGGLGETMLYLNGILVKRYLPSHLHKNGSNYILSVSEEYLKDKYVSDQTNNIKVISYAAQNDISSRGIIVPAHASKRDTTPPNLYAVMIGVSEYKGEGLNLRYPSKDAEDLSAAISVAGQKLFQKEHVFVYNLTSNGNKHPAKQNIQNTISEISKKSRPNDILLIFFAGHGIMANDEKAVDKKRFYFLTADASPLSLPNSVSGVGISTDELTKWIDLSLMKAQKRILIFDACNSGGAINDMQSQPGAFQVRNDDNIQQIKAIDKLNEQSGSIVLSASASDQPAYELTKYEHGLLTYALLRAIKLDPSILDGNLLNVGRWFDAGKDAVTELSKENGDRQQPQLMTNTNFNIGKVDAEVASVIKLTNETPVFAHSSFQNSDKNAPDPDELELSRLVDQQLNDIASRGPDAVIIYNNRLSDAPDSWLLLGRYEIQDQTIKVTVSIKQNGVIKNKTNPLIISGSSTQKEALAAQIVKEATEWILVDKKEN